jgi:arsenate reductase-like glutaredoxin family protein
MDDHNIVHVERNMKHAAMTKTDFLKIIAMTQDAKELVASNHLKEHILAIEEMRLSELYEWLREDKRRIRRPIIVDFARNLLHIGFHREDLLMFMSREQRIAHRKKLKLTDYYE